MTQLAAKGRVLTLVLGLFYIFTGSGLDRLTYQGVSMIHRHVVFPCKGKGCQCDKAGYELLNCQCRHDEGVSCCSTDPSPQETCCSDMSECESDNGLTESISNVPCQGEEETLELSLLKHVLLEVCIAEEKLFRQKQVFESTPTVLTPSEIFPKDKVPIFS